MFSPRADRPIDARELPDDADQLDAVLGDATVIGRVAPRQKQAIVGALQRATGVIRSPEPIVVGGR